MTKTSDSSLLGPVRVVRFMGEPVHAVTEAQVVAFVLAGVREGRGGWVVTHNLDHLRRLKTDPSFARLCAGATLRTADGRPLLWAARLRGTPLPERVAGSDLVWSLSAALAAGGHSVFLLGGNPGTADRAASIFRSRYPGLRIAGTACPEPGFEREPGRVDELCQQVARSGAEVTYVALGSPKQERLAARLCELHPRGWSIGVGISLSFVTGEVRRAPAWMRAAGLEWAHRLAQEPGRLARRYLIEGIPFAARLMFEAATHRDRPIGGA